MPMVYVYGASCVIGGLISAYLLCAVLVSLWKRNWGAVIGLAMVTLAVSGCAVAMYERSQGRRMSLIDPDERIIRR